jgi:hypothetical protein
MLKTIELLRIADNILGLLMSILVVNKFVIVYAVYQSLWLLLKKDIKTSYFKFHLTFWRVF